MTRIAGAVAWFIMICAFMGVLHGSYKGISLALIALPIGLILGAYFVFVLIMGWSDQDPKEDRPKELSPK